MMMAMMIIIIIILNPLNPLSLVSFALDERYYQHSKMFVSPSGYVISSI